MTDAMAALLQHAEEHMIHTLMTQTPEYSRIRSHVEQEETAFCALLTKETTKRFEEMMAERRKLDYIYEQALFSAGFQIALELVR